MPRARRFRPRSGAAASGAEDMQPLDGTPRPADRRATRVAGMGPAPGTERSGDVSAAHHAWSLLDGVPDAVVRRVPLAGRGVDADLPGPAARREPEGGV